MNAIALGGMYKWSAALKRVTTALLSWFHYSLSIERGLWKYL